MEINAGLDFDAAGRDAEIDDDGGAELERCLDLVHAARRYADGEETAAAEQRNGDAERMFASREVELDRRRPRVERKVERSAQRSVGEREYAHPDRGKVQRIGGAESARRHDESRRIGETVAGDEAPDLVDELERPAETHRLFAFAQPHADVGLPAVLRVERDLLEPENDESEQIDLEVGQLAVASWLGGCAGSCGVRTTPFIVRCVGGLPGSARGISSLRSSILVTSPDHSKRAST